MEFQEKSVPEKKSFISSLLRFFWLFCLNFSILFLLLTMIGKEAQLELRAWFKNFSLLILIFGLPVSGCIRGIGKLFKKMEQREGKNTAEGIFVTLLLLVLVLYLAAAALFGKSCFEKETRISGSVILATTNSSFLGTGARGAYYQPVALLFKQEYAYDDARVVRAVLQQRYEEEFTVGDAGNVSAYEAANGAAKLCSAVPKEDAELVFHVRINLGFVPCYTDDYTVVRQNRRGMEYLQKYWPGQEVMADEKESSDLAQKLTLICRPETDWDELAECMAGMIACVLEDSFFENHGSAFRIAYVDDTGNLGKTEFTFGNIQVNEGTLVQKRPDFYTDPQNVRKEMDLWVSEWDEEWMEGADDEEDISSEEEWVVHFTDGQGLLTAEGAYEKLFETVFEPDGFCSETTYNAKGNFYAILSKEEDAAGEAAYRTVVYNRESTNGKCHIFVYYNERGGNTRIMDFYAVDKEDGRVIAGNKKAWDQVASKEYQEATGEK